MDKRGLPATTQKPLENRTLSNVVGHWRPSCSRFVWNSREYRHEIVTRYIIHWSLSPSNIYVIAENNVRAFSSCYNPVHIANSGLPFCRHIFLEKGSYPSRREKTELSMSGTSQITVRDDTKASVLVSARGSLRMVMENSLSPHRVPLLYEGTRYHGDFAG